MFMTVMGILQLGLCLQMCFGQAKSLLQHSLWLCYSCKTMIVAMFAVVFRDEAINRALKHHG